MSCECTHQFCLACDKQTDGDTYCSESCKLADYAKTSPSSSPSSPSLFSPWRAANPSSTPHSLFHLSPAYDFRTAQRSLARSSPTKPTRGALSASSSHSSLCSMRSNSSASDTYVVSEKARRELLAYAGSFESVRLQRRRSH